MQYAVKVQSSFAKICLSEAIAIFSSTTPAQKQSTLTKLAAQMKKS